MRKSYFFGIMAFVYEQKLTSLLTTSGVVAMIIGLAIQVNISNIFSGIAINIERSFRVGDWVKIGTSEEGIVTDVNWRATRIKTKNGYILSIPNSTAAESEIYNFSYTDGFFWMWPTVYIDPIHPAELVEKVSLEAIHAVDKGGQHLISSLKKSTNGLLYIGLFLVLKIIKIDLTSYKISGVIFGCI